MRPGDRVAIALPNAPSFVAAYFGALWIGAVAVPLNILLRPREIDERLEAVSPAALVFDEERERELGPLAAARGLRGRHARGVARRRRAYRRCSATAATPR